MALIEGDPVVLTSFCSSDPKIKQHRFSAQRRKRLHLRAEIGKREIGRLDRRQQPSPSRVGQAFDFLWLSVCERAPPRRSSEGFHSRWLGAFLNPHPVVNRQAVEFLHQSARPADRCAHWAACCPQTKENILAVLRKKSRSRL